MVIISLLTISLFNQIFKFFITLCYIFSIYVCSLSPLRKKSFRGHFMSYYVIASGLFITLKEYLFYGTLNLFLNKKKCNIYFFFLPFLLFEYTPVSVSEELLIIFRQLNRLFMLNDMRWCVCAFVRASVPEIWN